MAGVDHSKRAFRVILVSKEDVMMKSLILTMVLVAACAAKEEPAISMSKMLSSQEVAGEPTNGAFVRVADPSLVCMVNDKYMGKPQIPVEVQGKTYYGCCKMCEKRLQEDETVRRATDPISHERVDKAVAVLARDPAGNVFYFAHETSFGQASK
jgi:YHS domain-containing protein